MKPLAETDFTLEPGTPADLRALAHLHYCTATPAGTAFILRARARLGTRTCGVLVVTYPVLNAPWRARAWPEHFAGPRCAHADRAAAQRAAARRANAFVRCIARVIIDPRERGLCLAAALVRAYLARPLTPCTEALAAQGAIAPFFTAAGMRAIDSPPAQRDILLTRRLSRLGLSAEHLLSGLPGLDAPTHAALCAALRQWARTSSATRAAAGAPLADLAHRAANALLAPRRIFVHESRAAQEAA
ncbi:hypothetical protein BH11PLA1_BH11PLA1_21520 [soil metagenome]